MSANAKRENVLTQGWDFRPLGEVVKPTRTRIKPSEKPDLPFIGMEHVEAHTMKLLGTVPAGTMKSSAIHFQPGDVLYGRLRPYLNKVYRPEFEGLCSAEFIVFPKTDGVDSRYLQHFLNSSAFVSFASHLNTGDRPRVDYDQLAPYKFPLAPLGQQERIVAEIEKQFSRLDEAVANLKRVKANLKRYKAAVLKSAVTGRLVETEAELARREGRSYETGEQLLQRILATRRSQWRGRGKYKEPAAPDTTDLPELPEGWVWALADQVMALITDGEHITPLRADSGVLLLSARNVLNGRLDLTDVDFIPDYEHQRLSKRLAIAAGDVLLSCSGSVGRSCVVPPAVKFSLVRSVAVLRPTTISSEFVCYQIQSPWLQSQIKSKQTQTAQANIFQGKIRRLIFALPPESEQERIVSEVDRRLSILCETEVEVDANLLRVQHLRKSILKSAYSGLLHKSEWIQHQSVGGLSDDGLRHIPAQGGGL